jgi:hypothetical protein
VSRKVVLQAGYSQREVELVQRSITHAREWNCLTRGVTGHGFCGRCSHAISPQVSQFPFRVG